MCFKGGSKRTPIKFETVALYLIVDNNVVFGRHVIGNVVVHDEPEQSVQQRQVDLFIHLFKLGLKKHIAFTFHYIPDILQIVDT
jgi:hypothetical protein